MRKKADAQGFAGQHQITPVYLDVTNADQIADAVAAGPRSERPDWTAWSTTPGLARLSRWN